MKINLIPILQKKYSHVEFLSTSPLELNHSTDLYYHEDEYSTLSVLDFLSVLTATKTDILQVITDDYLSFSTLTDIIDKIESDKNKAIMDSWNIDGIKKQNKGEWALLFLEDISNEFKCSLVKIIEEIKTDLEK